MIIQVKHSFFRFKGGQVISKQNTSTQNSPKHLRWWFNLLSGVIRNTKKPKTKLKDQSGGPPLWGATPHGHFLWTSLHCHGSIEDSLRSHLRIDINMGPELASPGILLQLLGSWAHTDLLHYSLNFNKILWWTVYTRKSKKCWTGCPSPTLRRSPLAG